MTIQNLKKPVLIFAGLLACYAILGFFVIPAVIKAKLPEIIQEQTGRLSTIQQVKFNPFSLEFSLHNFAMKEQDQQQDFVSFKEFYVNTEAFSSLFQLALVFDEVRLTDSFVKVERNADKTFNFSDLLTDKEEAKPEEESDGEIFPLKINVIKWLNGQFLWQDNHFKEPVIEPVKPINLVLENFSTVVNDESQLQLTMDMGSGGHLEWQGKLSISPLESDGHIRVSEIKSHNLWKLLIQDKVGFIIKEGEKTIQADYQFSFIDENLVLMIKDASFDLKQLKIAEKGKEKILIDIPAFSINGIDFDLAGQKVTIDSVSTQDAKLLAWLSPDGSINYQSLFKMVDAEASQSQTPKAQAPDADTTEKKWQVQVNTIDLKNYDFQFEDRTTKKPVHIGLSPIDFTLTDFTIEPGAKLPFQLSVAVNKSGRLKIDGSTTLEPFSAALNLNVNDIALRPFQPYVEPFARLNFIGGKFNTDGQLVLSLPKQGDLQLKYAGNSSIRGLHTRDKKLRKDFVKWRSLKLSKIDFNLNPMRFTVADVLLDRPYARVTIKKDHSTNLNDIFVSSKETTKAKKTEPARKKPGKTMAPYYKINKFRVRKGSSDFSDYSIILPFVAKLTGLNGGVRGVASAKNSMTYVDLKGKVYDLAPVEIKGKFTPDFSNLDIAMHFDGMPLPYVSPYSAEFAGHKIEKGKLSLDLQYKVVNRKLTAENKLVIDQLTLGEPVESPNAVSLPLGLAIALLKDANGVINIDLPLSGSLDDPEFSIWGLVGDALLNLLTKIVSSPFQALASLAGSDMDFSTVEFVPGSAELNEQQKQKLDKLAKALSERPNLKLEVKGIAYVQQDWPAMQEDALLDQLKKIKQQELLRDGKKVNLEDIKLSEDEYQDLLSDLFIAKFPELGKRNLLGTPKLIGREDEDFYEVAKNKMASIIAPNRHKLKELAITRSRNIVRHVVQQGGIDIARVFVLDSIVEETAKDDVIASQLSLGASS